MHKSLYIERNTPIHRLDPRIKITGLCLFFLISVILTDLCSLSGVLLGIFLLILVSQTFQNLWQIKWLVLVISLMCILFWLPSKSLPYGIMVALRLDIMLFAGILFASCIRVEELSLGFIKLGMPYRIAFSISLAFRLIPSLFSIIQTTTEAQQIRGLNLKEGHLFKRALKYIPLFIPVISILLRDAHHLSMALESKGFGFANRRTVCFDNHLKAADFTALTLLFLLFVLSMLAIFFP